jgi:hypothetical protein
MSLFETESFVVKEYISKYRERKAMFARGAMFQFT